MSIVVEQIPTGTWQVDRVHSTVGFSIRHMVVATFRSHFEDYDAVLEAGEDGSVWLGGTVSPASIVVKDENMAAHLQSPDFFDTERYPELRFEATSVRHAGDGVVFHGELTIKGHTHPVEAGGTISGPVITPHGERIGLQLTTVIDRRTYGLEWNAPLPKGGFALGNKVTVSVDLELARP
jgi:polyisoprenoid-binding protein YceI